MSRRETFISINTNVKKSIYILRIDLNFRWEASKIIIPKKTLLIMTVLLGTVFVGTTAVQGKVLKTTFDAVSLFDFFAGYDPGTSWISGNIQHVIDNINPFVFIVGPIEGYTYSYGIIMNNNLVTGVGVGSAFTEITGTWVGGDEFNGLPFYCYGHTTLRKDVNNVYTGTINFIGTLGDYAIHLKVDFITGFNPAYGFANIMSGELTIHL